MDQLNPRRRCAMSEAIPLPANPPEAESLRRRLLFARRSFFVWDSIFCRGPLSLLSHYKDWQTPRLPDHLSRIVYDAVECLRTGGAVPELGNVELAPLDNVRWPQHPRYLGYWHDASSHTMAGLFVGADIIPHDGRYYLIELNQGPSIYARRRAMYADPFDPFIVEILTAAATQGFETVVPVALRWSEEYVDEWQRAGRAFGIAVTPVNCPLRRRNRARHIVALPDPLPPRTMVVLHSGLNAPAFSYLDNKWRMSTWMPNAIASDLPASTRIALPETSERFFVPRRHEDRRWPNLVIKLAGSARSRHVLAARFDDESEGRTALGLTHDHSIPRPLRPGYLKNLLLYGTDRVLYQEFIPPDLDAAGHAMMIRLHLFVSPLATSVLSAHYRVSPRPVPDHVPRGLIRQDDAFVFNDAGYRHLPPNVEAEVRDAGTQLGSVIQRELERRFECE